MIPTYLIRERYLISSNLKPGMRHFLRRTFSNFNNQLVGSLSCVFLGQGRGVWNLVLFCSGGITNLESDLHPLNRIIKLAVLESALADLRYLGR